MIIIYGYWPVFKWADHNACGKKKKRGLFLDLQVRELEHLSDNVDTLIQWQITGQRNKSSLGEHFKQPWNHFPIFHRESDLIPITPFLLSCSLLTTAAVVWEWLWVRNDYRDYWLYPLLRYYPIQLSNNKLKDCQEHVTYLSCCTYLRTIINRFQRTASFG